MDLSLTSVQLVRLLASPTRRSVVAALTLSDAPLTHEALASAANLSLREVVEATDRLVTAGLVIDQAGVFTLDERAFTLAARAEADPPTPSVHGDQPVDVARVLDTAFRNGKLVQWPAKRSKRLIVLDYLAQQFDIGIRYSERQVNDKLRVFNDDVATSRRYLVDEQFLDRGEGAYWRCGGSF